MTASILYMIAERRGAPYANAQYWGRYGRCTVKGYPVVCIHFTIYFFRFTFTAVPASLTVIRKRTDYARNESSPEHSFPVAKVPGNFHSSEQWFPVGTFAPRSEKSWHPVRHLWICTHQLMSQSMFRSLTLACRGGGAKSLVTRVIIICNQ